MQSKSQSQVANSVIESGTSHDLNLNLFQTHSANVTVVLFSCSADQGSNSSGCEEHPSLLCTRIIEKAPHIPEGSVLLYSAPRHEARNSERGCSAHNHSCHINCGMRPVQGFISTGTEYSTSYNVRPCSFMKKGCFVCCVHSSKRHIIL